MDPPALSAPTPSNVGPNTVLDRLYRFPGGGGGIDDDEIADEDTPVLLVCDDDNEDDAETPVLLLLLLLDIFRMVTLSGDGFDTT